MRGSNCREQEQERTTDDGVGAMATGMHDDGRDKWLERPARRAGTWT